MVQATVARGAGAGDQTEVQWCLSGKRIVSVLSERGNAFSQKLLDYADPLAVADHDDCAVELDRVFNAIEHACSDIDLQAGHTSSVTQLTT